MQELLNYYFEKIKTGDTDEIDSMKSDFSLNVTNKNGDTPLHVAARYGHKQVVRSLLRKGASINQTNNLDQTPLAVSSLENKEVVKKYLKKKGAL